MARNAVLGVSGSVAAYRAADLARELMRRGYEVRVCLTDSAANFVTPALFEALTGNPCLQGVFDEPIAGHMAHIDWARWASVLVVAPATANTLSRLAHGMADDILTTIAIASAAPWVLAPAMNPSMYAAEPTIEALRVLRSRAASIVEPTEGDVACGENGQGKLAGIEAIVHAVELVSTRRQLLAGKRVLITSGPTQEPIDDVRMLTNRSSGKMGAALARAALLLGAEVTVVSGPASAPLPRQAEVVRVQTALEMLDAVNAQAGRADVIVGAAAVADFHPLQRVQGKLRRSVKGEKLTLELAPNPDVIAAASKSAKPGAIVVGFAAETTGDPSVARQKLLGKGLAALAMNDVSRKDIGFESDENELHLLKADGTIVASGKMSKLECAIWLFGALFA